MSDRPTPETNAIHLKHGITHAEYRRYAQRLERERDALAEALMEMRYGHTDKAEKMAVAALKYLTK